MNCMEKLPRSIQWKINLGVLEPPPSLLRQDIEEQYEHSEEASIRAATMVHSSSGAQNGHEVQMSRWRRRIEKSTSYIIQEIQSHNQSLMSAQRIRYESAASHHRVPSMSGHHPEGTIEIEESYSSSNHLKQQQYSDGGAGLPFPPTVVRRRRSRSVNKVDPVHAVDAAADLFSHLEIHPLSRQVALEDPLVLVKNPDHHRQRHQQDDHHSNDEDKCNTCTSGLSMIPSRQLLSSSDLRHLDLIEKDVNRLPRNHHLCRYILLKEQHQHQQVDMQNTHTANPSTHDAQTPVGSLYQERLSSASPPTPGLTLPSTDTNNSCFQFIENYLHSSSHSQAADYKQDSFFQQSRQDRNQILIELLYVYAKEHELNIGYRQGFHELLSWILLVLEMDLWEHQQYHRHQQNHEEEEFQSSLHETTTLDDESNTHQGPSGEDLLLPYLLSTSSSSPYSASTPTSLTPLDAVSTPTTERKPEKSKACATTPSPSKTLVTKTNTPPSAKRELFMQHKCHDIHFLKHDAYIIFEALLLRLAPAYDVLDPSSNDDISSYDFLTPTSYSNLLSEMDEYLMNKVITLGRNLVLDDDDNEDTFSQTSQHQTTISMTSIGTSILNHIRVVAGDEDMYWFLKDLSVPPELYCTRWIRLLLSREVAGWENVLQLWDFFFDISSIGTSRNHLNENKLHLGLMEVLECAAASMLLLEREPLLKQVPPTPNGTKRQDPSDKIDLLVNYPTLENLSLLKDYVIFLTHQLNVMRKHEGSNPFSPKDFFFVQSPQHQRFLPPPATNTVTSSNNDYFTSRYRNRYKKWGLNLKPSWVHSHSLVPAEDGENNSSIADEIELVSNENEINSSPFRVLQKSKLLKSAWTEASRRMMSKLDSMIDSSIERTPDRKNATP